MVFAMDFLPSCMWLSRRTVPRAPQPPHSVWYRPASACQPTRSRTDAHVLRRLAGCMTLDGEILDHYGEVTPEVWTTVGAWHRLFVLCRGIRMGWHGKSLCRAERAATDCSVRLFPCRSFGRVASPGNGHRPGHEMIAARQKIIVVLSQPSAASF